MYYIRKEKERCSLEENFPSATMGMLDVLYEGLPQPLTPHISIERINCGTKQFEEWFNSSSSHSFPYEKINK